MFRFIFSSAADLFVPNHRVHECVGLVVFVLVVFERKKNMHSWVTFEIFAVHHSEKKMSLCDIREVEVSGSVIRFLLGVGSAFCVFFLSISDRQISVVLLYKPAPV